ncbi:MAG TPA: hypothetical protein VFG36_07290 [Methanoregula sp.]|nr:hypothetical protein [Methanoregula sp.]
MRIINRNEHECGTGDKERAGAAGRQRAGKQRKACTTIPISREECHDGKAGMGTVSVRKQK